MLDSTEMTSKFFADALMNSQAIGKDDTLDLPRESISDMEPTTLFPHKENNLFPEIRRSMSNEHFECKSPKNMNLSPKHLNLSLRITRRINKVDDYFKTVDNSNEFHDIELNNVQVDPKKIEKWIAAALKESLKKGYIVKSLSNEKKSLLKIFGIDRQTLSMYEIDGNTINRLYRAMYVYSLGFYEIIKESLERWEKAREVTACIWKAYSVLLQFVCKTEYSTIVGQLTKAYQLDVAKLEEIIDK